MSGLAGPAGGDRTVAPKLAYLPALDGVRALAVGGVMAYHLGLGFLPGGFLGVDLFFVLSGFLISTLLMREHAATGRIALSEFWLRRARRLLPALFLVIAAVAVAALWSSPFDRDRLRGDILSSLFYVANWRFIVEGQSYFQEFASPSPVLHLWSLAIEEQFYGLWPLLTASGLGLVAWRRWGAQVIPVILALGIGLSVIALALTWREADPSAAYYATHTRAHELLVGALAAWMLDRSPGFAALVRRVAPLAAGLAIAVLALFGVLLADSSAVYYFGGSLAFSVAAATLIASLAASAGDRRNLVGRGLSIQPLPWIGMISYGLYLWHWPVILWVTPANTSLTEPLLAVVRVAATLGISALSFFLVERPIRHGRLGSLRLGVPQVAAGALGVALVLSGMTVFATRGALRAPQFVEGNRQLITHVVPDARGAIGLIGDSVAMSFYPGLAERGARDSQTLAAAAFPGCPIGVAEHVAGNGVPFPYADDCPQAVQRGQTGMVDRFQPSVIFWISNRDRFPIRQDGVVLAPASPEWEAAAFGDWDGVLDRLTAKGAKVVLILPFHRAGDDPTACSGDEAWSEECTRPILSINSLRAEYRKWAAEHPEDVVVVDPDPILCPSNPCPDSVAGVTLRSDPVHFTEDGARLFARELVARLPDGFWP
ncbi:MAG TPA: acyltransferase family protein [Candidatus Limnocylindria bacterium]